MDEVENIEVRAAPKAVRYIQDRGGRLYVWADSSSLEHVRTEPPNQPVEFIDHQCDGFTLSVDRSIAPPTQCWTIVYHAFPFRRLDAIRDATRVRWPIFPGSD